MSQFAHEQYRKRRQGKDYYPAEIQPEPQKMRWTGRPGDGFFTRRSRPARRRQRQWREAWS